MINCSIVTATITPHSDYMHNMHLLKKLSGKLLEKVKSSVSCHSHSLKNASEKRFGKRQKLPPVPLNRFLLLRCYNGVVTGPCKGCAACTQPGVKRYRICIALMYTNYSLDHKLFGQK